MNNAKKRAWTHATTKENWFEEVSKADVSIHVGAPLAAVDRMLTEYPKEARGRLPDTKLYFYTLEFDESTTFHHQIEEDPETSILETGGRNRIAVEAEAVIYQNLWEAPGTLSVETYPAKMKVAAVQEVLPKDLYSIRSLYNL